MWLRIYVPWPDSVQSRLEPEGSRKDLPLRILWILILAVFIVAGITVILSKDDPIILQQDAPSLGTPESTPENTPDDSSDGSIFADEETSDEATALAKKLADSAASPERDSAGTETTSAPRSDEDTTLQSSDGLDIGMDRTIASATVIKGNIRRVGANELEVDDEFTLMGAGTEENPYRPTWEYLYSAGDVYAPRLGDNDIPQRIALLDGAWVSISGYTVFPLVTGKTTELLIMLNQWDGCCIGVPPTPFDAIEVGLTEAVMRGPKHSISFGTITGRLKVDPYLIEDWLVGLYLLEEGKLQPGI